MDQRNSNKLSKFHSVRKIHLSLSRFHLIISHYLIFLLSFFMLRSLWFALQSLSSPVIFLIHSYFELRTQWCSFPPLFRYCLHRDILSPSVLKTVLFLSRFPGGGDSDYEIQIASYFYVHVHLEERAGCYSSSNHPPMVYSVDAYMIPLFAVYIMYKIK